MTHKTPPSDSSCLRGWMKVKSPNTRYLSTCMEDQAHSRLMSDSMSVGAIGWPRQRISFIASLTDEAADIRVTKCSMNCITDLGLWKWRIKYRLPGKNNNHKLWHQSISLLVTNAMQTPAGAVPVYRSEENGDLGMELRWIRDCNVSGQGQGRKSGLRMRYLCRSSHRLAPLWSVYPVKSTLPARLKLSLSLQTRRIRSGT